MARLRGLLAPEETPRGVQGLSTQTKITVNCVQGPWNHEKYGCQYQHAVDGHLVYCNQPGKSLSRAKGFLCPEHMAFYEDCHQFPSGKKLLGTQWIYLPKEPKGAVVGVYAEFECLGHPWVVTNIREGSSFSVTHKLTGGKCGTESYSSVKEAQEKVTSYLEGTVKKEACDRAVLAMQEKLAPVWPNGIGVGDRVSQEEGK